MLSKCLYVFFLLVLLLISSPSWAETQTYTDNYRYVLLYTRITKITWNEAQGSVAFREDGNYVFASAAPNSHYTYGSWQPYGLYTDMQLQGENQETAKIKHKDVLHDILHPYSFTNTYTYTFTYKPEITSISGIVFEANGSQCTDQNVSVTATMEESPETNGFVPDTQIHLHSTCNDPTFYFDHWEKKIGNDPPQTFTGGADCTYTVDHTDPEQNIELIAVYRRKPTLTINVIELNNAGNTTGQNIGGMVEINGQLYDTPLYLDPNSSNNRLEAFPDNNHTFDHWEGDGISTGGLFTNPHQQNPYADGNNYGVQKTDVTVTVYFRKKPTITITAREEDETGTSTGQIAGGDISADNVQLYPLPYSHLYSKDNQIQLKAVPDQNHFFDHWEGTGALISPKELEYTYTVGSSDATITAVFRKQPDQANYSAINIDPECGGTIYFSRWSSNVLATAWLQAVPNSPNYEFVSWQILNGITSSTNPALISLIANGSGYTLHFMKVKSTIKFSCVDEAGQLLSGTTNLESEGHYAFTSVLQPSAEVDCYELVRWEIFKAAEECGEIPTSPTSTITDLANFSYTVDEMDAEIHAIFRKKTFTITTSVIEQETNDPTGGTVSMNPVSSRSDGKYDCGTSIELTAAPDDCHSFAQWSDGNTDNPRSITVSADAEYQAVFSLKTANITLTSDGHGTVEFDD